jgi:hypothetical protein
MAFKKNNHSNASMKSNMKKAGLRISFKKQVKNLDALIILSIN